VASSMAGKIFGERRDVSFAVHLPETTILAEKHISDSGEGFQKAGSTFVLLSLLETWCPSVSQERSSKI
jgi:hypothetical protein